MHPDLASHLHTEECNLLIEQLKSCHQTNQFLKFFGQCNEADKHMRLCLRRERLARQARNLEKSKEKQSQMKLIQS